MREQVATPQLFTAELIAVRDLTVGVTHDKRLVEQLVDTWHSRLRHPQGWRVAFLMAAGPVIVGVATFGRPVARHEDQETTMEFTRMALSPDAPKNAATFMLGKMRRWIRENMPQIVRLISYQDIDAHHGTIYKADNWTKVAELDIGKASWTNRYGRRTDSERQRKAKWERKP